MRVLVLSTDPGIPLYGPSGASAHLRGTVAAFAARGDEVRVAVPRLADDRGRVDDLLDVDVIVDEPRRWRWLPPRFRGHGERWDAIRLANEAVRDFAPDLVWERYALFGEGGTRIASRQRDEGSRIGAGAIRHVLEVNAPLSIERARYGRVRDPALADRVERLVLASADRVVCVSAWLAAWARDLGAPPERVRHVPNGVRTHAGDRDAARRRLGLDGLVLGFVGTMKPWHGLERLPALLDALPEATALVVGDGPTAVPAHPRLVGLGRVAPADLPDVVAAMDVGLAPYGPDAPPWFCPLKLLEYRAQGVPVVASDVGDCRLLTGEAGIVLSPSASAADWASAVRRAAEIPRRPTVRSWGAVVAEALAP